MTYGDPVDILLATYNGKLFLREQIESILLQTYPCIRVLARDDGSSDGTQDILQRYAEDYPGRFIVLPPTPGTGSAKQNFLRLLAAALAMPDTHYFAFADQDDVWVPEKIEWEVQTMCRLSASRKLEEPLLVFSDLKIVDRNLNLLFESTWAKLGWSPESVHRIERLLPQNIVTGSTVLINRPLALLALQMPPEAHMHDWWLALLSCTFGAASALERPTVLYRQHDNNVTGVLVGVPSKITSMFRPHGQRRTNWESCASQASAFLRLYGEVLSPRDRRACQLFVKCQTHPYRLVRVWAWLRGRFFLTTGLRPNLAFLWYLWDMDAAKREPVIGA